MTTNLNSFDVGASEKPPTPACTGMSEDDELEQFLGGVNAIDPDSIAGRHIDAFDRLVTRVPKPPTLLGENNYTVWAESVDVAAQQAGIHVLLRQDKPTSSNQSILSVWWTFNDWLFGLSLRSLPQQALSHITVPERLASTLWCLLRDTFAERPEARRRKIVSDMLSLSPHSCGLTKLSWKTF